MANTNRDLINSAMGSSQDPNQDDYQSAMGAGQYGGGGPAPTATIDNTSSNSSLQTSQVSGAPALFASRQADLDTRSNAA
jgi:hypothetical protein